MKYVVEKYGNPPILVGPFESAEEAAEWAAVHVAVPWTLRTLHIIPPQGEDA